MARRPQLPPDTPAIVWVAIITAVYAAVILFAVVSMLVLGMRFGRAQHNHAQHHPSYQNWINQKGEGCCDNRDCGTLAEQDEREREGRLEVRIEGQWCPVLPHHYLKAGNVPDATTAHVCAWLPESRPDLPHPCQRLLCYQPRPLS